MGTTPQPRTLSSFFTRLGQAGSRARQMGSASRQAVGILVAVTGTVLAGAAVKEKFVSPAYRDPIGIPTLGYGTTAGVKMGDTITPERALIRLLADMDEYARTLRKCITAPLYQYEFDAYLDLAYNIGASAFCRHAEPGKPPSLVDLVNAQRYEEACARILEFDKARDPRTRQLAPMRGLTVRRQEEFQTCIGKGPTQ